MNNIIADWRSVFFCVVFVLLSLSSFLYSLKLYKHKPLSSRSESIYFRTAAIVLFFLSIMLFYKGFNA